MRRSFVQNAYGAAEPSEAAALRGGIFFVSEIAAEPSEVGAKHKLNLLRKWSSLRKWS